MYIGLGVVNVHSTPVIYCLHWLPSFLRIQFVLMFVFENITRLGHQLRLYGHVARLPAEDPAHRILSCRHLSGWTMPRGRPQASWLRQVEAYL